MEVKNVIHFHVFIAFMESEGVRLECGTGSAFIPKFYIHLTMDTVVVNHFRD